MPINGPATYVPTTDEFTTHWSLSNEKLGEGNHLTFPDGTSLNTLLELKSQLVEKRQRVKARLNEQELARADLHFRKVILLKRMVQFNERIRGFYAGSKWEASLPLVPNVTSAQSKITEPLDKMVTLWEELDSGIPSALVLEGEYDQHQFAGDVEDLKAAYTFYNGFGTKLNLVRLEREQLQDQIYDILKSYRQVLPTFFKENDPIVLALPRLTPLPGSTPQAVNVTGQWDEESGQAKIVWDESTNANLKEYEIRYVPGPEYETEDELVLATFSPGSPREFLTLQGFTQPGLTTSFKVYVITDTGNEKGSNAVSVSRPLE